MQRVDLGLSFLFVRFDDSIPSIISRRRANPGKFKDSACLTDSGKTHSFFVLALPGTIGHQSITIQLSSARRHCYDISCKTAVDFNN
jgi:hypothetical protein